MSMIHEGHVIRAEWNERVEDERGAMAQKLERDRRILAGLIKRWRSLATLYCDIPSEVEDAMAEVEAADDSLLRAVNRLNEGD